MSAAATILAGIAFVAGLSVYADNPWTRIADQKRAKIEALATDLPEDRIFYRWQSKKSGDALLTAGGLTDRLHAYFMGMNVDDDYFAAGAGVYMADNPHSSNHFLGGADEGSLIEVHLAKGSKTLDVTDPKVVAGLREAGLSVEDAYRLDPALAIRYEPKQNWWIVKDPRGVTFHPFDGASRTDTELIGDFAKLESARASRVFVNAVSARVRRSYASNARPNPKLLPLMREEDQLAALASRPPSPSARDAVLKELSPKSAVAWLKAEYASADPPARDLLVKNLIRISGRLVEEPIDPRGLNDAIEMAEDRHMGQALGRAVRASAAPGQIERIARLVNPRPGPGAFDQALLAPRPCTALVTKLRVWVGR